MCYVHVLEGARLLDLEEHEAAVMSESMSSELCGCGLVATTRLDGIDEELQWFLV